MTKEDVLQKVNEWCNEKNYTSETLTDEFKEKFSEHFAKKYPNETNVDDDGVIDDIRFNISTAFSATSNGLTGKQKSFEEKENSYKQQIEELQKKIKNGKGESKTIELPEEIKTQLEELKQFKDKESKVRKTQDVIALAKQSIRTNLHKSFESFAKDCEISLDKSDKEQADAMVARFQDIFKDAIGDIKPLAPFQQQKKMDDFLNSLNTVTVQ